MGDYWIVSVPKIQDVDMLQEFERLPHTKDVKKFRIPPELKVGNIDLLFRLSDALKRLDSIVKSTVERVATLYSDLAERQRSNDTRPPNLAVKKMSPKDYLTTFKYDKQRYASKALDELVQIIRSNINQMDKDLKTRTSQYNQLEVKLKQVKQNSKGSLLTRDLTKDLESLQDKIINSQWLTTLFVVVPRAKVAEWKRSYESISEYVVPRSSECLKEEGDYSLYKVVVLDSEVVGTVQDFKEKCTKLKFTVRKYDPSQAISAEEIIKLKTQFSNLETKLTRWSLTVFGEAYMYWVHLKCIQCFVESILRFGLPVNFESVLIQSKPGSASQLEKALCEKFAYLGRDFEDDSDDTDVNFVEEKFYPFVFSKIPTEFGKIKQQQ